MTDQPRWPKGTPTGPTGPGAGRWRGEVPAASWADAMDTRAFHAQGGLASLVPDSADQYRDSPTPELDRWARHVFDYDGPGGTRSQVRTTRGFHFNGGTWITIAGDFTGPADGYYQQGRPDGGWSVEIRYPPSAHGQPFASIQGIEVRQEARGHGVARAWLQRLEGALRAAGVARIELMDVSHAGRGTSYWHQFGYRFDPGLEATVKYL